MLTDNRNLAKGLAMEYVAPSMVNDGIEIEIEQDDIASEVQFWENPLTLYVLGTDLSMHTIKSYMMKTWNFVKLPDMYYHEKGFFLL